VFHFSWWCIGNSNYTQLRHRLQTDADTQSTLKRTGERARGLASTRFSAFPVSAAGLQPAANARGSLREYQFPQLALNCV